MAQEPVVIPVSVLDNATQALVQIVAALEELNKKLEDNQQQTEETEAQTTLYERAVIALDSTLDVVTTTMTAVVDILRTSTELMLEATGAAQRYDAAQTNLNESLQNTGATGAKLNEQLTQAATTVEALNQKTGTSVDQLNTSLAKLIDTSGNLTTAENDLRLAADIAARKQIELSEATDIVNDARKGAAGPAATLLGLTESENEVLGLLPSKGAVAAKTIGLLAERFGGAADQIQSTALAQARLASEQDRLVASIGQVIDRSGVLSVTMDVVRERFASTRKEVNANSEEAQQFAITIGQKVVRALGVVAKGLVSVQANARLLVLGFDLLGKSAAQIPTLLLIAANKIQSAIIALSDDALGAINSLLGGLAKAADFAGRDELAASLRKTQGELSTLRKGFGKEVKDLLAEGERLGKVYDQQVDAQADIIEQAAQIMRDAGVAQAEIDKLTAKAVAGLEARRKAVKRLDAAQTEQNARQNKQRKELAAAASARDARLRAQARLAVEVARAELAVLKAQTDADRLRAEAELRRKQAQQEVLGIENAAERTAVKRLRAEENRQASAQAAAQDRARGLDILIMKEEQRLAILQKTTSEQLVELRNERALVQIQADGLKGKEREIALLEAEKEEREGLLELRQQEVELAEKQRAQLDALASSLTTVASTGSDAAQKTATGFAGLLNVLGQVREDQAKVNAGLIKGSEATVNALGAAGQASATFAAALGASAAEQAGILAIFETASAVAAFATGNIASGAQHLVAAGLYGTIAGVSAGSGGGGGGAGAAGAATAPSASANAEAIQQQGAQLLATEIADALGAGAGGVTIIVDQRGAMLLGDADVFESANRGAQEYGINLQDVRRMN